MREKKLAIKSKICIILLNGLTTKFYIWNKNAQYISMSYFLMEQWRNNFWNIYLHFITKIGDCKTVSNPTSTRRIGMSESIRRQKSTMSRSKTCILLINCRGRNTSCPSDQTMTVLFCLRIQSKIKTKQFQKFALIIIEWNEEEIIIKIK